MIVDYIRAYLGANYKTIKYLGAASATGSPSVTVNFSALLDHLGQTPTLAQNDIIIYLFDNGNTSDRPQSELLPSGYTAFHTDLYSDSTADTNLQAAWKVMGATPDSSVSTPTVGGSFPGGALTCIAFRNVDTTTPADVTPTTTTAINTGVFDPPSITPVTDGAAIVAFGGDSRATSDNTAHSAPQTGGFNAVMAPAIRRNATVDVSIGAGVRLGWAAADGAVDCGTMGGTVASGMSNAAVSLALRPAEGSPDSPLGPTIRGSRLTYVNNANSVVFTLPASSAAGDFCVIMVGHAFAVTTPAGWTTNQALTGTNTNGSSFYKVLTSGDISTGSVTISFGGTSFGHVGGVTFVGGAGEPRTFGNFRNSTGATSRTQATWDDSPRIGDMMIRFSECRGNVTVSMSDGTNLAADNQTSSSAVLNWKTVAADGSDSCTFNYSSAPTSDYGINWCFAPTNGF